MGRGEGGSGKVLTKKIEKVDKIVKRSCQGRVTLIVDCCLSLCLKIQGKLQFKAYIRVTSFNINPNFSEWVLSKTQILEICIFLLGNCYSVSRAGIKTFLYTV